MPGRKSQHFLKRRYHRSHDLGITVVFKMTEHIPPHVTGLLERPPHEEVAKDRRHRSDAACTPMAS